MMENYRPRCSQMRKRRRNGVFLLVTSLALSDGLVQRPSRLTRLQVSNIKDEIIKKSEVLAPEDDYQEQKRGMGDYLLEKMGSVDESRVVESTANAPVSALISSTLLMGASQTLGWVVLPDALQQTGLAAGAFSLSASCMYSGIASMLLAEYCLNAQIQDESLVRIYQADSNPWIQRVGTASFFFLQYFLLIGLLGLNPAVLVPTTVGLALGSLRQLQQGMQIGYVAILVSILGLMAPELGSLDWTTLLDGDAQHPDQVLNALPTVFTGIVASQAVPSVVAQLEGDRNKIWISVFGGTAFSWLAYLVYGTVTLNGATVLTHALSTAAIAVSTFSISSSLREGWKSVLEDTQITDTANGETVSRLAAGGLTIAPAAVLVSTLHPDWHQSLEYAGIFGISTLFLVLPPIMVWKQRYTDVEEPLRTMPMVPFGKIPLGSLWKTAGTLIIEQGAEKIGVFEYIRENFKP